MAGPGQQQEDQQCGDRLAGQGAPASGLGRREPGRAEADVEGRFVERAAGGVAAQRNGSG